MIQGLSPRTRGKLVLLLLPAMRLGPIPANTGETPALDTAIKVLAAYPREHGGNCSSPATPIFAQGLSPRTRGKR